MMQSHPAESRFQFSKEMHLRKSREFDRVFQKKMSVADEYLVIYVARNDLMINRLGLVVSRKVGKAHLRNRWKRLLRELFRLHQHQLPQSVDFVIIPRKKSIVPDYQKLEKSFEKLIKRISLIALVSQNHS